MSGIIGQYMKEFGLVVVCATLFSLLVSFTLTPLLAAKWALVRKPRALDGRNLYERFVQAFQRGFEWVKVGYHDHWLPRALGRPFLVFFGSFALVVLAIGLVLSPAFKGPTFIPGEFQPYTEWGEAVITLQYPAGTPISVTQAAVTRLSDAFAKMKGVRGVSATVGRGSNGFSDVIGGHMAELRVYLYDSQRHREHTVVAAAENLGYLAPGAHISASGAQNAGAPPITYTVIGAAGPRDAFAAKLAAFIAKNPAAQRRSRRAIAPPDRASKSASIAIARRRSASPRKTRRRSRAPRSAA